MLSGIFRKPTESSGRKYRYPVYVLGGEGNNPRHSQRRNDMTHGTLINYRTGEDIRPATRNERMDSLHATLEDGGRGAFETDDGLVCYVECSGVETDGGHFDSPWGMVTAFANDGEEVELIQDEDGWRDENGALVLVLA